MNRRKSCRLPDDEPCVSVGKRGPCGHCHDMTAHAERMRKRHADPDFAKAHAERAAERMRKRHADPDFAKAHAERAAERMRKRHADPDFAKANAERMRKMHADPDFAKANAERMRKMHADPDFARANARSSSKWPDCPDDLWDEYRELVRKGVNAMEARSRLEHRTKKETA